MSTHQRTTDDMFTKSNITTINREMYQSKQNIDIKIAQLRDKNGDIKIVLLIGITGSGKTTLKTILLNNNLSIILDGNKRLLDRPGSGIVHNGIRGTEFPSIDISQELQSIFADCPGFEDRGGHLYEIKHAFAIKNLLQKPENRNLKVKILLVASCSDIESERSGKIIKQINRIQQMFNNEIIQKIGLVISKVRDGENGYEDYTSKIPELNRFFTRDRVFTFPYPSTRSGIYHDFSDLNRLKQFIRSENGFIINPEYHISFNEETKHKLISAELIQLENINTNLTELFRIFENECKNSNIEKIDSFIEHLNYLKTNRIENCLDFAQKIESRNITGNYTQALGQIKESHFLTVFIEKTLNKNSITEQIKNMIINHINNTLEQIQKEKNVLILKEEDEKKETRIRELQEEIRERDRNEMVQAIVEPFAEAFSPLISAGMAYGLLKIPAVRNSRFGDIIREGVRDILRPSPSTNTFTPSFGTPSFGTPSFGGSFIH